MTSPARVFISYSRRDYYFAESLSLQLVRRGVPAWMDVLELQPGADWERSLFEAIDGCAVFVLVASPAALASPYVRAEWQRALAQGRRVLLLAWHRRVRLPAELQGCEWLDFRGRFGPALERLARLLCAPLQRAPRAGPHPGSAPRMPPAVLTVLAALLLPIAGYAYGTAPDMSFDDVQGTFPGLGPGGGLLLIAVLSTGVVWLLSLSLLQRRMGMTRLMCCLGFVAAPFLLTLWKLLRHGAEGVSQLHAGVGQRVLEHLPWVGLLAVLPVLAMAWIVWVRPLGLLHWMPTGKAWERQRSPGQALRPSAASPAQAMAAVRRYRLLHDTADAPLADGLRACLARQGAVEAADQSAQPLLLLSNRTGRDWLSRHASLASDPTLQVVVGAAISLPESAGWLWRRQWVDLRRGPWGPSAPAAALPALPESVTQVRLPPPVARLHALLCALAVLVGFVGYLLSPQAVRDADETTPAQVAGGLLFAALVWCARGLLRRAMAAPALRRWLVVLMGASLAVVVLAALGPGLSMEARATGAAAAVAAALIATAARREWPQAQPWLPLAVPLMPASQALAPAADWRTTLTVVLFVFAWMLPVQLFAPQLMGP